jgi:hypothetical protein
MIVKFELAHITQACGPPLEDEHDAQMREGIKVQPDWNLATLLASGGSHQYSGVLRSDRYSDDTLFAQGFPTTLRRQVDCSSNGYNYANLNGFKPGFRAQSAHASQKNIGT